MTAPVLAGTAPSLGVALAIVAIVWLLAITALLWFLSEIIHQ